MADTEVQARVSLILDSSAVDSKHIFLEMVKFCPYCGYRVIQIRQSYKPLEYVFGCFHCNRELVVKRDDTI